MRLETGTWPSVITGCDDFVAIVQSVQLQIKQAMNGIEPAQLDPDFFVRLEVPTAQAELLRYTPWYSSVTLKRFIEMNCISAFFFEQPVQVVTV